jgi:hypothetical protein
MNEFFCYARITGDWNKITYSKRKSRSTKNTTVKLVYFVPEKDGWQADFKRGMTFFNPKEGMLFGARVEMMRFGKFVEKSA